MTLFDLDFDYEHRSDEGLSGALVGLWFSSSNPIPSHLTYCSIDPNGTLLTQMSDQFHNFNQISQFQPNFTISTKFHNFHQLSQFPPNFTISTKFHNFDQISQFPPNFTISTKFHNFNQISKFQPNFKISTKFQNSTKFQKFDQITKV